MSALEARELISIVVPVYNEAEVLEQLFSRLYLLSSELEHELQCEMIFVDDGSSDGSLKILRRHACENDSVRVVSLSRNFGHQAAVTAGVDHSSGDYVALIDADLQDPPELIAEMLQLAKKGNDIVYGQRLSREGDTIFKRSTASVFYRAMNYLCDIDIPVDTGDFRLMTRRAVDAFSQLRESHRFVRGMVPWIGFQAAALPYHRQQRAAGNSKYPVSKMLQLASEAMLSFSTKPMSLVIRLGVSILILGVAFAIYILFLRLFSDTVVPGFTVIILLMTLLSGAQILIMGMIGAYIGRIFEQVKDRPLYIERERINL